VCVSPFSRPTMALDERTPKEHLYNLNEFYGENRYPIPFRYKLKVKRVPYGYDGDRTFRMYQCVVEGCLPLKPYKQNGDRKEKFKTTVGCIKHYSIMCCESDEAERIVYEDWLGFCNPDWRRDTTALELIA